MTTKITSYGEVLENTLNSLSALDETVAAIEDGFATHKALIEGLVNNVKWLQDNSPTAAKKSVEESYGLIEHEGKMLRKVKRRAKTGDFVKFYNVISALTQNNKFYEVVYNEEYRVDSSLRYSIYGWEEYVRVEVYEVFYELPFLPQSDTVAVDENVDVVLTTNQKRAKVIEKAKKIVDEFVDYHDELEINFIVNREKRTVVMLARKNGSILERQIAKCHSDDTFNEHIGKAITALKAHDSKDDEIFNAPNPNSWVVGQITKGIGNCEETEEQTIVKVVEEFAYNEEDYFWVLNSIENGSCMIVDDTNAEYEVSK